MKNPSSWARSVVGLVFCLLVGAPVLHAESAPAPTAPVVRDVVDLSVPSAELVPIPTHVDLVRVGRPDDAPGIDVRISAGKVTYPGITFRLGVGEPDLSGFGYVEARITNTGEHILNISLRVDSIASGTTAAGTGTSAAYLKPGESGVARVYFARPRKGSAPISPNLLSNIFLFVGRDETQPRSFRLESLTAGGRPGDLPSPRP